MSLTKSLIFGVLILYLQVFLFSTIDAIGLLPNIIIGYLVYLNLYNNQVPSLLISFILGLAIDLTTPFTLGMNAGLFTLLTFIVKHTHNMIDKEKFMNNIFAILILNVFYFFMAYVIQSIADSFSANMLWQFFLNVALNSLISVFVTFVLVILHQLRISVDENVI